MASALKTAELGVLAQIETDWGTTTPIAWPNEEFTPPRDAWIRPTVLWGGAFVETMGADDLNAITGVLSIAVFVPKGEGPGDLLTKADTVRDISNRLTVSNVRFQAASGPIPVPDPEWYQVVIQTPFTLVEAVT